MISGMSILSSVRVRAVVLVCCVVVMLIGGSSAPSFAQTAPTVEYTYDVAGATPQMVQDWQPILYVNNVRFPLGQPSCAGTAGNVICTVAGPDFSAALTPTGDQRFELALRNGVLNIEGERSGPFTTARPGAPTMRLLPSPPSAPSP